MGKGLEKVWNKYGISVEKVWKIHRKHHKALKEKKWKDIKQEYKKIEAEN